MSTLQELFLQEKLEQAYEREEALHIELGHARTNAASWEDRCHMLRVELAAAKAENARLLDMLNRAHATINRVVDSFPVDPEQDLEG